MGACGEDNPAQETTLQAILLALSGLTPLPYPDPIGVKGKNGTTIASLVNQFPVTEENSAAILADLGLIYGDTTAIRTAVNAINAKFDVNLSTRASEVTVAAINTNIGDRTDASAASDTGTASLIALTKRMLTKQTSMVSVLGSTGDAAATDTTSAWSINSLLRYIGNKVEAVRALLAPITFTSGGLNVYSPPVVSSTLAPLVFNNFGADVTKNVKATAGNIFSLVCFNASIFARYIQIHNTATVPAGGAVPVFTFLVPPGGQIGIGTDIFTDKGANLSTGIAFAFSTTRNTYTAAAAADQTTTVFYI